MWSLHSEFTLKLVWGQQYNLSLLPDRCALLHLLVILHAFLPITKGTVLLLQVCSVLELCLTSDNDGLLLGISA